MRVLLGVKKVFKITLYIVLAGVAMAASIVFGGGRSKGSTLSSEISPNIAHADVPYSEASYYSESSYIVASGEGGEGGEGGGGGEGGSSSGEGGR